MSTRPSGTFAATALLLSAVLASLGVCLPAGSAEPKAATPAPPAASVRTLTFEDRVEAQRAIERVYWNHRIWPKENPEPKPPLSAVTSDDALRAKVEDYLGKSSAMELFWHQPVTAGQLQAEMDRMAAHTRDGEVLQELFGALGNDPHVIAETLARQTLVDRLVRNWHAFDPRFQSEAKDKAAAALAACRSAACMKSMDGDYHETRVRLRVDESDLAERSDDTAGLILDGEEWRDYLERLGRKFGAEPGSLPIGELSGLEETQDALSATTVLSRSEREITVATVVWPKVPFESWWSAQRGSISLEVSEPARSYVLPAVTLANCTNDTWSPTRLEAPDPRYDHSTVWTGTEMIVWGGQNYLVLNTGGRYNPSTDTWTLTSTGANVPTPRYGNSAVWTGTQMIVWGGYYGSWFNTGGRYDPSTDTWTATPTGPNVPSGRFRHTAVWTGTEMIVWGGYSTSYINTGGLYNPSAGTWTTTSTGANTPSARHSHTAVWTGTQMIVWGGNGGSDLNTGGLYDPSSNTWTATSTGTGVPSARRAHTAVWTGSRMIVWGGTTGTSSYFNTGGLYDPSGDTWTPTSTGANVPSARSDHAAVWTGTKMIVWGGGGTAGSTNSGASYDPSADSWAATSTGANVPTPRGRPTGVWTGAQMIVWGGSPGLNTGGRYDPSTDSWTATSTGATVPSARRYNTAVWTGTEMIVWGGYDGASYLSTGGRYLPATDTWTPTSTGANLPATRQRHTAVWTGKRMIVWGGNSGSSRLNTGGRYDPSTDTWTATSTPKDSWMSKFRTSDMSAQGTSGYRARTSSGTCGAASPITSRLRTTASNLPAVLGELFVRAASRAFPRHLGKKRAKPERCRSAGVAEGGSGGSGAEPPSICFLRDPPRASTARPREVGQQNGIVDDGRSAEGRLSVAARRGSRQRERRGRRGPCPRDRPEELSGDHGCPPPE